MQSALCVNRYYSINSTFKKHALPTSAHRFKTKVYFTDYGKDIIYTSNVIGQSIVYFTMFYTTVNFLYYRSARLENKDKDKPKNK